MTQQFQELARSARDLVAEQRKLLIGIQRDWQLRIDSNAQRAGEAQAKAFGESIAQGLHAQLAELAAHVETSTRRLTWKTSLRWALGIGIAIPLTINLGIRALSPGVDKPIAERTMGSEPSLEKSYVVGLTAAQTRQALSKLSLCQVAGSNNWHTCIEVDTPAHMGLGSVDRPRVVVRGM